MEINPIEIIGSGSKGNSVLYFNGRVMIDAGMPYIALEKKIDDVKVILLTHIHGDHFNTTTIKNICAKHPNILWLIPYYLEQDFENLSKTHTHKLIITFNKTYKVFLGAGEALTITPLELFHDVRNAGYKLIKNGYKVIHLTDTNYIEHIDAKDYDLYAIECNHDEGMINQKIRDAKPEEFVYEIRSRENHLSFQKTIKWFNKQKKEESRLIPLHVSHSYDDSVIKEIMARELL